MKRILFLLFVLAPCFAMAQKALAKEVENYACAMPEVRWFCDTYLESFKKTLDELE